MRCSAIKVERERERTSVDRTFDLTFTALGSFEGDMRYFWKGLISMRAN